MTWQSWVGIFFQACETNQSLPEASLYSPELHFDTCQSPSLSPPLLLQADHLGTDSTFFETLTSNYNFFCQSCWRSHCILPLMFCMSADWKLMDSSTDFLIIESCSLLAWANLSLSPVFHYFPLFEHGDSLRISHAQFYTQQWCYGKTADWVFNAIL